MKTYQSWLSEYAESHQNTTNILIHWLCVPIIFFSIISFFFVVKIPIKKFELNLAQIISIILVLYYMKLSIKLGLGMMIWLFVNIQICKLIAKNSEPVLLYLTIGLFVIAWIGQFIGHQIEGKKPSFLKDLQFLLIGPMWLMCKIYKKIGIIKR